MNVLGVFAHPDDEVIAAGGALAQHVRRGDEVSLLIFTDGVTSRATKSENEIVCRREECHRAGETLGASFVTILGQPDQMLDGEPLLWLSRHVEEHVKEHSPEVVYTHWLMDLNKDHRLVAEAVLVATRPVVKTSVRQVLAGEVPESSGYSIGAAFSPNVYVVLDPHDLRVKQQALACYRSEVRYWPHPRSLRAMEARANLWGGLAGADYAEPFVLMREVRR